MTVGLSLVTITGNKPVLDKIREFILSLLDNYSYLLVAASARTPSDLLNYAEAAKLVILN